MASITTIMLRVCDGAAARFAIFAAACFGLQHAQAACPDGRAPIYLTFDTGSQSQAILIRDILKKYDVKATFFLANEKTVAGDFSLDPSWSAYWKSLVADGHAFGTHTFDHVYFKADASGATVMIRPQFGAHAGQAMRWTSADYCDELNRVKTRFQALTGATLDPFWRAPGGKVSARLIGFGKACGYRHFAWADAGFLGDELPSDRYPNAMLLERAKKNLRAGDIVMAHLGIWSRKNSFAPTLDPLIASLKQQGHCFATLRDVPTDVRS